MLSGTDNCLWKITQQDSLILRKKNRYKNGTIEEKWVLAVKTYISSQNSMWSCDYLVGSSGFTHLVFIYKYLLQLLGTRNTLTDQSNFKKLVTGAREMAQQSRALAVLADGVFSSQRQYGFLQLSVTLVPWAPTPSSGLWGHWAHTWCTNVHAGNQACT